MSGPEPTSPYDSSDCDCCCDGCNDDRLNCDKCCRCVPKGFCFKFTPDNSGDACNESNAYAPRITVVDTYNNYVISSYMAMGVDVRLEYDAYSDSCFWHVISVENGFDESYPVRGVDGKGCVNPSFTVPVTNPYCPGTISITKYELAEVAFTGCDYFCGTCRCACKKLCVTITGGSGTTSEEWDWNGAGWGSAVLSRDQYTGQCIVTHPDYPSVAIDSCGSALSFQLTDGYTTVVASCKRCNCFIQTTCCFNPIPCTLNLNIFAFGEVHNPMSPPVDGSCNNADLALHCLPLGESGGEVVAIWETEWINNPCCTGITQLKYRVTCQTGILGVDLWTRDGPGGTEFSFNIGNENNFLMRDCDPFILMFENLFWGLHNCGVDGFAWVRFTITE